MHLALEFGEHGLPEDGGAEGLEEVAEDGELLVVIGRLAEGVLEEEPLLGCRGNLGDEGGVSDVEYEEVDDKKK